MSLKRRILILLASICIGFCVLISVRFVVLIYKADTLPSDTVRTIEDSRLSPDGEHVAYLETLDFGGGPGVGHDFQIVVVPASKTFNKDRDKEWIWWSHSLAPHRFYWKDSKTIEVVVPNPGFPLQELIEKRRRYGIGAETKVIE